MFQTRSYLLIATVVVLSGCAEPVPRTSPAASSSSSNSTATNASASDTNNAAAGGQAAPTQPSAAAAADSQATEAAPTERVQAQPGVGQRGRSLDQFQKDSVQKIISTPAREYFLARERIVFEIAVPQALSLYKAEHGEAPASHEDFMRDVVEFNNIELPELPPGSRYVYDPQTEQLLVERPAKSQ